MPLSSCPGVPPGLCVTPAQGSLLNWWGALTEESCPPSAVQRGRDPAQSKLPAVSESPLENAERTQGRMWHVPWGIREA